MVWLSHHDIPNLDIPDLKRAIVRTGSNFDLDKVRNFLDDIPSLSKEYKEVCLKSMEIRNNYFIKDLVKGKVEISKTEHHLEPEEEQDLGPEL